MKRRPSGRRSQVLRREPSRPLGFGLVGDDEPVFIVRGKDAAAAETIEMWGRLALAHGAHPALAAQAGRWAERVREWQRVHGARAPSEGP
jgi:hypothetical protein